jgi:hypothetical protein
VLCGSCGHGEVRVEPGDEVASCPHPSLRGGAGLCSVMVTVKVDAPDDEEVVVVGENKRRVNKRTYLIHICRHAECPEPSEYAERNKNTRSRRIMPRYR